MDKTDERKIYELGYLLVPYLPAEEVAGAVEKSIKAKINALGGEMTSEMPAVMTRLAYVITNIINNKHTKFSDAYFGAMRFKLAAENLAKLEAGFKKDDQMIRYLVIAMPKGSENIVLPKRTFAPRRDDKSFEIERIMPEVVEDKPMLSAEDLDKEIDKLVEPAV